MNKIMKIVVASAASMTVLLSAVTANICMTAQAYTVLETPIVSEETTFEADNFTYSILDESHVSVTGITLSASEIEVPQNIVYNDTEYTVTEIGERAFERKGIRIIKLPSTITAIGNLAFYYSSIQEIEIPDSVVTIGNGAFSYCDNLNTLTIPEGVTAIGERAFSMSHKLESVTLPATLKTIGKDAFYMCSALKAITYASSEESWNTISIDAGISENVTVICDADNSKTYNTSELVFGQKLSAGDILHYDDVNGVGSLANIVNENGSFDIAFINEKDYVLPWNAELVGIDGLTIYLAPENENIKYVDVRTLNVGDIIESGTHLLCYDYVTNSRVSPVFLPSYYEKYVGEGTIKLKAIDHEAKRVTLEAVMETVISGDTNGDGEVNVADAVILQKYLSCAECELLSSSSADLNHDDTVNAFDMVLLRRQLLAE